jgi:hypothetical protein
MCSAASPSQVDDEFMNVPAAVPLTPTLQQLSAQHVPLDPATPAHGRSR